MTRGRSSGFRPGRPATGAINPQSPDDARRMKRSTPDRRTGVLREKDQRQTPTAGQDRARRTGVNSVDSIRAGCRGPTSNSALPAFPLGRLNGQPVQQGSRTQVSRVGNLGESQQRDHYYRTSNPDGRLSPSKRPNRSVWLRKTSEKVLAFRLATRRASSRVTSIRART